MSEKKMRKKVLEILSPIGAYPVENSVCPGMPDIVCVAGWLELKIASRPSLRSTKVSVDVRPAQRIWLRRWRQHGGRAWTLTKLDDLWLLHDGLWASERLGLANEDELIHHSVAYWRETPTFEQLAGVMIQQKAVN